MSNYGTGLAAFVGCLGLVLIALAFGALGGVAASWVLSYFGVTVPWYVCWVGMMLIGGTVRTINTVGK